MIFIWRAVPGIGQAQRRLKNEGARVGPFSSLVSVNSPAFGEAPVAEFPALPLFTDAYLADTRHLTAEEHGAYLLLLMCAWRTRGCALKDCDQTLARTVGVTRARWRKLKPVMLEFFTADGGVWQQKKLSDV